MEIKAAAPESVIDCWIISGSSENGNILWITNSEGRDVIVGGYTSVAAAQKVAYERFNVEPVIDPYWIVQVSSLTRVKRAARRRASAVEEYRAAIFAARDEGCSLRAIANAAGVSHVAVLKMLRG